MQQSLFWSGLGGSWLTACEAHGLACHSSSPWQRATGDVIRVWEFWAGFVSEYADGRMISVKMFG